ncbi:hypothetical protein F5Y10DRAFT_99878 [Nemania abortiva]|nr:hypothetical protein F5Y10DRAFT_99878 [Nemania abortiva]
MVYVRPRKGTKCGPKKFPGSRRTRCDLRVPPVQPLRRPQRTHSRATKTEVMLWLINNRIAVSKTGQWGEPYLQTAASTRRDQVALTDEDRATLKKAFHANGVIYRPPTFKEAAEFFKISTCNIQGWWTVREKYLSPEDLDRSKKLPVCEVAPGVGIPKSAPRPQIFPEIPAATNTTNSPDGDDNNNGNDDEMDTDGELPPLGPTRMSDDSDFNLEDDSTDLSELETALNEELSAQARQNRRGSSDGGQNFEDAPEYQEREGELDDDESDDDDDADHEPAEEADMYGTG